MPPVRTSRLLRAINLSIAVLLLAFLAAAYWYLWRPLGETSGQISAPISAAASITRDAQGVPHIRAASWEDAIFLEGYAMAQDRLWQMDALRRRAAGELAEVVGAAAVASDQDARRLRLRKVAEQHERSLPPQERALFAAFARGVNAYIETHRGKLPLEFGLLQYDPRPWGIRDSLLAGMEMYRTLTSTWQTEVLKMDMLERGEREKVEFLFPTRTGGEPQPGSNAWAVSGAHSATGNPILANDPHLEFQLPSPWYLVHLEAPGLDVTGAAIVGLPAVIVGHNQNIAWGVTNLEFDVQDLYREELNPQTGRYLFRGQMEQARLERDLISVKGGQPVQVASWITRHGPVVVNKDTQQYALRWTASEPEGLTFPFLDIDRARNWEEFTTALARYAGPGQNFVYADTADNIGYHATGHLPVRKNCGGDVPADGAKGECEWEGYIPFEQLPQAYNPASGVIVSANANPFPADFPRKVNGRFSPPDRALQIRQRLAKRAKWKPEEMLSVQADVYSAFSHFLAQQVVSAWDKQKAADRPQLAEAVETLRPWNGQMEKGLAAPMLATLVYEQFRRLVAEQAAAGLGSAYTNLMAPSVIEKLLRERPQGWFPDYDAALLRCLTGAIAEGQKAQGSKVTRWDYGQFQSLRIASPVAGALPVLGKYFNIGPVSMSGSPTTVKQYTRRLGPSLRMIVDLADLDGSLANLATGESGQRLSGHYKDQWDAYAAGRSFPMQFGKVEGDVLRVMPR